MPIYNNINGTWRESTAPSTNINSVWRNSSTQFVHINQVWRQLIGELPDTYLWHDAYLGNDLSGTFYPDETAWYKIYCIGNSPNGSSNPYSVHTSNGHGGSGSGGIAVSVLWLSVGVGYSWSTSLGNTVFYGPDNTPTGTSGGVGWYLPYHGGGVGGEAYNGTFANASGFAGGNGGYDGAWDLSGRGTEGESGGNTGMTGGHGGGGLPGEDYFGGGGGGGGARLPHTVCSYVYQSSLWTYRAGNGGNYYPYSDGTNGDQYPETVVGANMVLYGGGAGAGGYAIDGSTGGLETRGTPACLIIEKGFN